MDSTKTANIAAKAIHDKKGERIVILDLRDEPCLYDYFVIAHSTSKRRLLSCAEGVQQELKKNTIHIGHVEGGKEASWVLVDAQDVIVHLFLTPLREYYDLEGLWRGSPRIYYEETLNT